MEVSASSRPSILDLMIFIAAVAVALAMTESSDYPLFPRWWDILGFRCVVFCVDLLATSTFALLVIRLKSPFLAIRELVCQPGFVACSTAFAARGFFFVLYLLFGHGFPEAETSVVYPFVGCFLGGWAVAGGWLCLAACRRWHSEPSWIDRTGRYLGVLWLVWPILHPTVHLLVNFLEFVSSLYKQLILYN